MAQPQGGDSLYLHLHIQLKKEKRKEGKREREISLPKRVCKAAPTPNLKDSRSIIAFSNLRKSLYPPPPLTFLTHASLLWLGRAPFGDVCSVDRIKL